MALEIGIENWGLGLGIKICIEDSGWEFSFGSGIGEQYLKSRIGN